MDNEKAQDGDAVSVKERPIIMSAPSVRAILAGTKTQTRRLVDMRSVEPAVRPWINRATIQKFEGPGLWVVFDDPEKASFVRRVRCPHAPGDRLWVKETFRQSPGSVCVHYRADLDEVSGGPWRSPLYMPRWASRLTLEVTAVRVERLQDISEDDAIAEGVDGYVNGEGSVSRYRLLIEPGYWHPHFYRQGFENAWDDINGKRAPWASNPWVWVVNFVRVSAPCST